MFTIFIDGRAGTTGLRIYDRLSQREDVSLIVLGEDERKNPQKRREALNSCDVAFLCLPDDAARESVGMIENDAVRVIDTSTAHRTLEGWTYGFPELTDGGFERVAQSRRTAVPGCHASGFTALVAPLIEAGILRSDVKLSCFSVTGYSGGGNAMIADYKSPQRSVMLDSPRIYALAQQHKHLKEMQAVTGLKSAPIFCPTVADFYSGMLVTVPVFAEDISGASADTLREIYSKRYAKGLVNCPEDIGEGGFICANALSGRDDMEIFVQGCQERLTLMARFDNLGKGASGAAVECLNLMMGKSPDYTLNTFKGADK